MKRHLFTLILAAAAAFASSAQNEQLHVYRNDRNFNSFKWKDITDTTYLGTPGKYHTMVVTENESFATMIDMNVVDSCVVRPYGIPEVFINLTDYPDWPDLLKDATHTKETTYTATLSIAGNGMHKDLSERTVTIGGRGNSTWQMPKTPYKIKMESKASVCGLPKAKSFCLINNYIDGTLMRNAIAFWVARYLGLPYSNHCVPVKVYFNGGYRGQYMLTEKIGINAGSVDIDETKGMLFELDSNYDEPYEFMFTWGEGRIPIMVKDPDIPEIAAKLGLSADEYWAKWRADFTNYCSAVVNRKPTESLADVLDIQSAVDFFIVNTLTGNREMRHPKSLYMYKGALGADDVYHFGPVWDFDWAYTFDGWEGFPADVPLLAYNGDTQAYYFFRHLFRNKEFSALYRKRWNEFVLYGYPELKKFMDEYAALIEPTAKENGLRWPSKSGEGWWNIISSWDHKANVATLREWLGRRISYCTTHPNLGLWD